MVELIFDISQQLSQTGEIAHQLGLGREGPDQDTFHALLFQLQMMFLVSHEYAHHTLSVRCLGTTKLLHAAKHEAVDCTWACSAQISDGPSR
jgi:hypothetical protein